jgi:hypothetical protein
MVVVCGLEWETELDLLTLAFENTKAYHNSKELILKLILATTLVVEGSGQSELGQRLYLDVKPSIESKLWESHTVVQSLSW